MRRVQLELRARLVLQVLQVQRGPQARRVLLVRQARLMRREWLVLRARLVQPLQARRE